ncbi:50S ribosomal protein L28 [Candidatus Gromoviella agglomerans]|uniref:50S ribosomal protein L28 n=1 Tax=Candidatus Gromoviella agglomerans TaxID=2806609 RepID=UPI001E4A36DF|nr:50S ribosomal protein L28 [Candidatus Gromoviella agglomerans]UFX98312.1 50S ribosomal protein L28 [Candidatus Gromoviella agglomerans]
MSWKCDLMGVRPLVGNNVSHAKNRTKRRFMPNLQTIRYFSQIMDSSFRFRVCTSTNRTIMNNGGFDAFMLSIDSRKLTDLGQKVKRGLMKRLSGNHEFKIRG